MITIIIINVSLIPFPQNSNSLSWPFDFPKKYKLSSNKIPFPKDQMEGGQETKRKSIGFSLSVADEKIKLIDILSDDDNDFLVASHSSNSFQLSNVILYCHALYELDPRWIPVSKNK